MKRTIITGLTVALMIAATGCENSTEPSSEGCCPEISPVAFGTVDWTEGDKHIYVESQRDVSWTVTSSSSWARVSPARGRGSGIITIDHEENPTSAVRPCTITFSAEGCDPVKVPFNQGVSRRGCECSISPDAFPHVDWNEADKHIYVTADSDVCWSIVSSCAWADVHPASGCGSRTITIDHAENPSTSMRRCTLTFTADGCDPIRVQFDQDGRPSSP